MIGLSGDWHLQPRWKPSSTVMGMAAHIGDVDGGVVIFLRSSDCMLTRRWGISASCRYSKLIVDVTKSGFNGSIDWRANGVRLYGVAKF
jgi:hypothetical protein